MKSKKWIKIFLIFSITLVLFLAGFNWLVDPYGIFNSPKIKGFNLNKPETESHQRIFKEAQLMRLKPQTILLGTSRTERGIDPSNKNFHGTIYNESMNSISMVEAQYMVEAAIRNGTKQIYIGTDLFSFYKKEEVLKEFDKDILNNFSINKYLFTMDTFKSSRKTVLSKEPMSYTIFGEKTIEYLQKECDNGGGHKKLFLNSENNGYYKEVYSKGFNKNSNTNWLAFEKILNETHKHGIKVILFISPSHARQWEVLALTQGLDMFEEFRRRLIFLNEKIALQNGKKPFIIWDFAGYSKLITEDVPENPKVKMSWYWDSSHYKKELGDILLDRMFDGNYSGGQNYPDFGVKITSQNIEAHLANLRIQREKYRITHPKDIAEIEAFTKEQH